jgi:hypothetical protein
MAPTIAPKATPASASASAAAPQPRRMFVFGAGFVGRYVSERLLAQGWSVPPRSPSHALSCRSAPFRRDGGRRQMQIELAPSRSPPRPIPDLGLDCMLSQAGLGDVHQCCQEEGARGAGHVRFRLQCNRQQVCIPGDARVVLYFYPLLIVVPEAWPCDN